MQDVLARLVKELPEEGQSVTKDTVRDEEREERDEAERRMTTHGFANPVSRARFA